MGVVQEIIDEVARDRREDPEVAGEEFWAEVNRRQNQPDRLGQLIEEAVGRPADLRMLERRIANAELGEADREILLGRIETYLGEPEDREPPPTLAA
jgi:hypothetical protein